MRSFADVLKPLCFGRLARCSWMWMSAFRFAMHTATLRQESSSSIPRQLWMLRRCQELLRHFRLWEPWTLRSTPSLHVRPVPNQWHISFCRDVSLAWLGGCICQHLAVLQKAPLRRVLALVGWWMINFRMFLKPHSNFLQCYSTLTAAISGPRHLMSYRKL